MGSVRCIRVGRGVGETDRSQVLEWIGDRQSQKRGRIRSRQRNGERDQRVSGGTCGLPETIRTESFLDSRLSGVTAAPVFISCNTGRFHSGASECKLLANSNDHH